MNSLREMICHRICGHLHYSDKGDVPPEVREASHQIANRSAEIQGSVTRIRKEADAMEAVALALRGTGH